MKKKRGGKGGGRRWRGWSIRISVGRKVTVEEGRRGKGRGSRRGERM